MTVTSFGGSGGYSAYYGYNGGLGGSISASFSVIPGQNFFVCVGGAGGMPSAGFYDGGTGGSDYTYFGGGGGGSTAIMMANDCSPVIKAGGGGGAGYFSNGGPGGSLSNVGDIPTNAQSAPNTNSWGPIGGGGGGYVGGVAGAVTHVDFHYYSPSVGDGGSGGTSYTIGDLVDYKIGANSGDGRAVISFSRSGNKLPEPVSPSPGVCYCVPPTFQPTGQPTGILSHF